MIDKGNNYIILVAAHIALAFIIFFIPVLSQVHCIFIFIFGIYYVNKTRNKNHEALLICGYICGSEVFIRATKGAFFYEYAKYGIIVLLFIGMLYRGIAKNASGYWIVLFLYIPSTVLSLLVLNVDTEDRKVISNVLSGPICLVVSALYCYQRRVTFENVKNILAATGLPILTLASYLVIYNPNVSAVVKATDSNFETSGGYGPNQVSTALGLGIFIFLFRLLLDSKNRISQILNFVITAFIAYRGIVTFSRGGIFTGLAMIIVLFANLYFVSNNRGRSKLSFFIVLFLLAGASVWTYSSVQTSGLINKRYANQDGTGKQKDGSSGRGELSANEIDLFLANPLLGVGVGKSVEIRKADTGIDAASHNEITRLLADHGFLGILILSILFITPILLFFNNKRNIFILPCLVFWGLTINHAAMRTAAPAFIYALALLKIESVQQVRRVVGTKG